MIDENNILTAKEVSLIVEKLCEAHNFDLTYKILNIFAEQQYYKFREEERERTTNMLMSLIKS